MPSAFLFEKIMKKSFRNVCKCQTYMRIFTTSNHTGKINDMANASLILNPKTGYPYRIAGSTFRVFAEKIGDGVKVSEGQTVKNPYFIKIGYSKTEALYCAKQNKGRVVTWWEYNSKRYNSDKKLIEAILEKK